MKILLTSEQSNFLISHGTHVHDGDDWFHLPHWYKRVEDGVYEIVNFENIPQSIKNLINQHRDMFCGDGEIQKHLIKTKND